MTVKQLLDNLLKEEFKNGYNIDGKWVPVYSTPLKYEDKKDLVEIGDLRFIADYEKDELILWDSDILHYDVAKVTGYGETYNIAYSEKRPAVIFGECSVNRGEIITFELVPNSSFFADAKVFYSNDFRRFLEKLLKKKGSNIYSILPELKTTIKSLLTESNKKMEKK